MDRAWRPAITDRWSDLGLALIDLRLIGNLTRDLPRNPSVLFTSAAELLLTARRCRSEVPGLIQRLLALAIRFQLELRTPTGRFPGTTELALLSENFDGRPPWRTGPVDVSRVLAASLVLNLEVEQILAICHWWRQEGVDVRPPAGSDGPGPSPHGTS